MFPTFESFAQIMDQCTENYECLVVNNNSKSNKLQDQIFWYKAQSHPDFRLGSNEFWELSKDLDSDDDTVSYNPEQSKKKIIQEYMLKNKVNGNVKIFYINILYKI
jgi:hypothetical protein